MTAQTFELNHCYNMDCMEAMAAFPNDYFDLAVVDPPYFSGPERRGFYGSKVSPTLMTGAGGNKTAVVQDQRLMESLVLNDQGGKNMDVSVNVTGTLRAQTHEHLPVVFQKSEDEENET